MGDRTSIEWTESSWTPVKGCTRASEGCRNCYAETMTARFSGPGQWGEGLARIVETPAGKDHRWTGALRFDERELMKPLSWRRPRMIFVCSTSDLFHEKVEDEWLDRIFAVMALAPQHTFQILTKRPEQMRDYLRDPRTPGRIARSILDLWIAGEKHARAAMASDRWPVRSIGNIDDPDDVTVDLPLPNVWLGVSAEDQVTADVRIPYLLDTPAAVRWVSAEPLIGPIDLTRIPCGFFDAVGNSLTGVWRWKDGPTRRETTSLDWIVAGGESGSGARPMHPDWVRTIRDQCAEAGVAFLFKQWGRYAPQHDEPLERYFAGLPDDFPDCAIHKGWRFGRAAHQRPWMMFDIGKKAAGRMLDGRLHDAFPTAEEVPFG